MPTGLLVFLIILGISVAVIIVLYFLGKKAEKKQEENQAQLEAHKQTVTLLVIDKKKMPLKSAGLPSAVTAQTPWYLRRSKVPVVKVKAGPQILTLVADASIFDDIPVKKTIKAQVSGIYIMSFKGMHGAKNETPAKKKGRWARFVDRIQSFGGAKTLKKS